MLRRIGFGFLAVWAATALSQVGCSDDDSGDCGNGVVEAGEDCDGDELDGRSCQSLGLGGGVLLCSASCEYNVSGCTGAGDCGNGQIDTGEDCDGGELAGQTCASQGFVDGTLGCTAGCAFDTSGCNASQDCGNGQIDTGEQCDGADLGAASCQSQGFDGGTLACTSNCAFDTSGCTSGLCGNGDIDSGEQCDGANLNSQDCVSQGFVGGTLGCTGSCTFDFTQCEAGADCGNGNIDGTEQCDGANLNGQDCTDLGFVGGTLSCAANCAFNTSLCVYEVCGNGNIEATEQCDGQNLGSQSCGSQGYDGGTLACAGDCHGFVTTGCCYDGCANAGDTTCNGDVLRTCAAQANGCLGYNDFDCTTGGQTCVESGGSAQCEGACTSNCSTAGATQCNGVILQTCTQNGSCLNWVDTNCFPGSCTGTPASCQSSGTGTSCGDIYNLDGQSLPHTISQTYTSGAVTDGGSCQSSGAHSPLYLSYTVTSNVDRLTITVDSGDNTTWPQISAWTTSSTTGFCPTASRTELGCNYEGNRNGRLVLDAPGLSAGDVVYFIVTCDWPGCSLTNPVVDIDVVDCNVTSTTTLMTLPAQLNDVVVDSNITIEFVGERPKTNTGTVTLLENSVQVAQYDLSTNPAELNFFGQEMYINPSTDFSTDVDVTVELALETEVCADPITDSYTFHTEQGPPPNGEDCTQPLPINNTGSTYVYGTYVANSADILPAVMSCYSPNNIVVDSVFTFSMTGPNTDVTIKMPKTNGFRYGAVLLDACSPTATAVACTASDDDETMILVANGLTMGAQYYLVVGNLWSDAFPAASFDEINIVQYRAATTPLNAAGAPAATWYSGVTQTTQPLATGDLPMTVDLAQGESFLPTNTSYRSFTVTGANGIRLTGYIIIDEPWHDLRAKDPAGVFYMNVFGPSTATFDVYVPGDTAIIGADTPFGGQTWNDDYVIETVTYH